MTVYVCLEICFCANECKPRTRCPKVPLQTPQQAATNPRHAKSWTEQQLIIFLKAEEEKATAVRGGDQAFDLKMESGHPMCPGCM